MAAASSSTVSFGDELPDQFAVITTSVSAHIGLAHDAAAYLAERAALEREYASKLQALTRKLGERRQKRMQDCTVGNDPSKAWSIEVANRSTLQRYVASLVSTSESAAGDHAGLGDALDKVGAEINAGGKRSEEMRKKHNAFYEKVVSEREKVYADRVKVKAKYDELCLEADGMRQKKEKAEAEGKHADKATKGYQEAQAEMWNAKNVYLVAISASNQAKARFYREDLPRLQDDLQSLWTLVDRRLIAHLQRASAISADHLEAIAAKHRRLESDAAQCDVEGQDQSLFVEFNSRRYDEPANLGFEPCVGFFDTPEMVVDESHAAKTFLSNMLIRKRQRMSEDIPLVNSKAKEIQGLERLRDAYLKDAKLGDPEEVTDNLLESVRNSLLVEAQLSILEAEAGTISSAIGSVGDVRPHRFKATKFALPATCGLCGAKVFGLSGLSCQPCGFVCHTKCEPKVAPECRAAVAERGDRMPTLDRSVSVRSSRRTSGVPQGAAGGLSRTDTARTTTSTRSSLNSSTDTASAPVSKTAAPARRTLPPMASASSASNGSASAMTASQRRILEAAGASAPTAAVPASTTAGGRRVRALYDYDASSPDELSIVEGDVLRVVGDDDGSSGWLKASSSSSGKQGLVPANYVEEMDASSGHVATSGGEGSHGKVRALYDYEAQESNELTLKEGEEIGLTDVGFDFGSGWCEGVDATGKTGVFPANYVERVA